MGAIELSREETLEETVHKKDIGFGRDLSMESTNVGDGPCLEYLDDSDESHQEESAACLLRPRNSSEESVMSPTKSLAGRQTSFKNYDNPDQTLLFVDWDDTLFPTTALLDQWDIKMRGVQGGSWRRAFSPPLDEKQQQELESWQEAVQRFLCVAVESATCVIVTNAKPGWVETCVQTFAPKLMEYIENHAIKVVYAQEVLSESMGRKASKSKLRPVKQFMEDDLMRARLHDEKMMAAKLEAMRLETNAFYGRYPGQSWKNILSFGDQPYERDALQELGMRRIAPQAEMLRIKTMLLPGNAPVGVLGPRLDTLRMLLPAMIKYNADFDINLSQSVAPFETLSEGLGMPKLKEVSSPERLWGSSAASLTTAAFEDGLLELSEALMDM